MELMLQVHSHDEFVRLSCHGNLICGSEAEALHAAILHLLSSPQPQRIVVDLKKVRKIDAAGIGVLADGARRALQHGCTLELADIPSRIRYMLRTTRLESIFDSEFKSVTAA